MTRIKICGITNAADALAAVQAGADLLGFIFYKPSPRYVSVENVTSIVAAVKRGIRERPALVLPQLVGVFVNASRLEVARTLRSCGLDRAQLHGEEPTEMVASFRGSAFKAIRPQAGAEAEMLVEQYTANLDRAWPPVLLLDAYHPTLYGGTGRVTDWTIAANIARRCPLMLAGSLTADNVAEAIEVVQPWGVDVSSGVEAEKGRKDHGQLRALVAAVRNVKSKHPNVRRHQ